MDDGENRLNAFRCRRIDESGHDEEDQFIASQVKLQDLFGICSNTRLPR